MKKTPGEISRGFPYSHGEKAVRERSLRQSQRSQGACSWWRHQQALAGEAEVSASGIPKTKLKATSDMIAFFICHFLRYTSATPSASGGSW